MAIGMIYLLIALLLKKDNRVSRWLMQALLTTKLYGTRFLKRFFVLAGLSGLSSASTSQQLAYDVIKGGEVIGKITISRYNTDSATYMKLFSRVKTSLLVRISVSSWEESEYRNGTLVYSSLKREINGRRQINRHIKWNKNTYQLWDDGKLGVIQSEPITHNIVRLYFVEPVNETRIFSESEKRWVTLQKAGDHRYRIILSGGNYNDFFYKDGICSRVNVNNNFFKATFKLTD
jgi:hypothetical protein